jgi:hypothetical protein
VFNRMAECILQIFWPVFLKRWTATLITRINLNVRYEPYKIGL